MGHLRGSGLIATASEKERIEKMKKYDITITFTLDEKDYNRYNKNIDHAIDLILPYGADYQIHENDYNEED